MVSLAHIPLGLGMLNAAALLRRIPELVPSGEEPRAVALGANAMPGRARSIVVATDERILWAGPRHTGEPRGLRLDEVESFAVDRSTASLTVAGGGQALRVAPVPARELEKFERLLSAAAAVN